MTPAPPHRPPSEEETRNILSAMGDMWMTASELEGVVMGGAPEPGGRLAAWLEWARKRGLVERNPDVFLDEREYRATSKGRELVRSRWLRWGGSLGRWAALQSASGALGAAISLAAGALVGASTVFIVDGATDVEAGFFGASIALLAVSLANTLDQTRGERLDAHADQASLRAEVTSKQRTAEALEPDPETG